MAECDLDAASDIEFDNRIEDSLRISDSLWCSCGEIREDGIRG